MGIKRRKQLLQLIFLLAFLPGKSLHSADPVSPLTSPGETLGRVKSIFAQIFHEATSTPYSDFDVFYDYRRTGEDSRAHALAIATSTRLRAANLTGPSGKLVPTLHVSPSVMAYALTDDILIYAFLHELYHEDSDEKIEAKAEELVKKYENRIRSLGLAPDQKMVEMIRQLFTSGAGKFIEGYSDLMAQIHLLRLGRDPRAGIKFFDRAIELGLSPVLSLSDYLGRSHGTDPERKDLVQHHYEFLKGNKSIFPVKLLEVQPTTTYVDEINGRLASPEYEADVLVEYEKDIRVLANQGVAANWQLTQPSELGRSMRLRYQNGPLFGSPDLTTNAKEIEKKVAHEISPLIRSALKESLPKALTGESPIFRREEWEDEFSNLLKPEAAAPKSWLGTIQSARELNRDLLIRQVQGQVLKDANEGKRKISSNSELSHLLGKKEPYLGLAVLDSLPSFLNRITPEEREAILPLARDLLTHSAHEQRSSMEGFGFGWGGGHGPSKPRYVNAHRWLTDPQLISWFDKMVHAAPQTTTDQLPEVENWLKELYSLRPTFGAPESTAVAKTIQQGMVKGDVFHSARPLAALGAANRLSVDLTSLEPQLSHYLSSLAAKDLLETTSGQVHIPETRTLVEIYDRYPGLRPALSPLLNDLFSLYQASQTNESDFKKRLLSLRSANPAAEKIPVPHYEVEWADSLNGLVEEGLQHPHLSKDFPPLAQMRSRQIERVNLAEKKLLTLPRDPFNLAIESALRELHSEFENGSTTTALRESLTESQIARQLPEVRVAMLLLLEGNEHPDFLARIRNDTTGLRSYFHTEIARQRFNKAELPTREMESLLRRTWKGAALRQQIASTAVAEGRGNFDFDRFQTVFGAGPTYSDFEQAHPQNHINLVKDSMVPFRQPEDVQALLKILRKATAGADPHRIAVSSENFEVIEKALEPHLGKPMAATIVSSQVEASLRSAIREMKQSKSREQQLSELLWLATYRNDAHTSVPSRLRPILKEGLEAILQPSDFSERVDLLKTAAQEEYSHFFDEYKSGAMIDRLYQDLLDSSLPDLKKAEFLGSMGEHLTTRQVEEAWTRLSRTAVYAKPYDEKAAAELISKLYGSYYDGRYRKMQQVFNHYELSEAEMTQLRDKIFPEHGVAIAAKTAEILRGAIKVRMGEDIGPKIKFLEWLNGKKTGVPELARSVISALREQVKQDSRTGDFKDEISRKIAAGMTTKRLLEFYQNNHVYIRMAVISDFISPNSKKGLLASAKGKERLLDFLTDGVDGKNTAFAREVLSAQLTAMGDEAHVLATQLVAATAGHGNNKRSDAERLKTALESKEGLWIKLGQYLSMDRNLVPDEEIREVLGTLRRMAAVRERSEAIKMLKEALGEQYSKVVHEGKIRGSGSVNLGMEVLLNDGLKYFARMVRGNPDNQADHEVIVLRETRRILIERSKEIGDPDLKAKLANLAYALGDYIEAVAAKMRVEADLRRNRETFKMLEASYSKSYKDLGVEMRLLGEADSPIEYSDAEPRDPKFASKERIILYRLLDPEALSRLTPEESVRLRKAMFRADLEAVFTHGRFDPDGHIDNWIWDPSAKGHPILYRIDPDQGEALSEVHREALRRLANHFFALDNPTLAGRTSYAEGEAIRDFKLISEATLSDSEFHDLAKESLSAVVGRNKNPLLKLSDWQAEMKKRALEGFRFRPDITMAMKGLFTAFQHLDPEDADQNRFITDEFLRIVVKKGTLMRTAVAMAKRMQSGVANWGSRAVKKGMAAAEDNEEQKWRDRLKGDRDGYFSKPMLVTIDHELAKGTHRKPAILEVLTQAYLSGQYDIHPLLVKYTNEELLLAEAMEKGREITLSNAAERILAERKVALYDLLVRNNSKTIRGVLNNPNRVTREFRDWYETEIKNGRHSQPEWLNPEIYWHLSPSNKPTEKVVQTAVKEASPVNWEEIKSLAKRYRRNAGKLSPVIKAISEGIEGRQFTREQVPEIRVLVARLPMQLYERDRLLNRLKQDSYKETGIWKIIEAFNRFGFIDERMDNLFRDTPMKVEDVIAYTNMPRRGNSNERQLPEHAVLLEHIHWASPEAFRLFEIFVRRSEPSVRTLAALEAALEQVRAKWGASYRPRGSAARCLFIKLNI